MDSNNILWKKQYVFAMMLSTLCMISSCCDVRDKEILLKFKEGVTDPSGLLSSWKQEQDCCQWKGVRCHNITARVINLTLSCDYYDPVELVEHDDYYLQKCLTGDINLSLLDMEYLQSLDLSFNDFTTISSDSTLNSSTLNYIDLSYNRYLSIKSLEWLSRIPSLEYIDLSNIDLHMQTNWLHFVTVLPSLVELHLEGCNLESISPSLGYANFSASLQVIVLSGNSFHSELPKWIFNLSSQVHQIDLSSNHFMGQLPNTLPNLHSLISLQLHDNYLNGSIPDWIGQLHYLTTFEIDNNHFSGFFPTNLGNLSSLDTLAAFGNLFTGVVSERNFAKLKNLKFLSLESPYITFDFDPLWIPPFQLDKLYIGPLHPTLPQWLYTQTSLYSLIIENSEFLLEAADNNKKFWRFTSTIQHLDFYNTTIEGDLSEVVLNSSIIELTSNNFKGGLPRLSSNVVFFQLYNSSLSGSISHLLCHSKKSNKKLQYLDISDNNLSGGLTDCWMNWKSLVYVNLGGNNLSGSIPPSMALLSNLTSLHLHENNLSGDISSSSLQYCRSLSILNVRQNSFSGNIPKWMPQSIRILQLRSNQFIGNIPTQICQMPFLIVLDIAYNKISGHIPKCLNNITSFVNMHYSTSWIFYEFFDGKAFFIYIDDLILLVKGQQSNYYKNLKLMRMVDLSSNNLTGTMSPQLFSLPQLHFLNLSHNRLTGTIPKEIGNMTQLESLDLSKNELTGQIPESISSLSFLDNLNLSFNNLSGQIPSGTQLQSFSELSYIGNADLCGPPLPKNCSNHGNDTKALGENDDDGDESDFLSSLYVGLGVGFAVGFWGVCGAIFFSCKCRHAAYFRFLYDLRDRFYVLLLTNLNSFH
ncbi:probably inactive leucine-rich repeat receptor-like protein kinase At3g28040 [Arachis ipaensis]|uniref:probably inactive leucine-rich repeat receptor-like protein kinase At3g28040 n=1 Tax=Arachis ipaensis TaxID=130454 RepID=UPI000A2B30C9|nr:probably inactive leucine-rich repeat receptor-like protein kinase At3g28040 [Arachis ipaensis]